MTKKEYMARLESQLGQCRADMRSRILDDCEKQFEAGRGEGKSDEEIIRGLGDLDKMIKDFETKMEKEAQWSTTDERSFTSTYSKLIVKTRDSDIEIEASPDSFVHVRFDEENSGEHEYSFKEEGSSLVLTVNEASPDNAAVTNLNVYEKSGRNIMAGDSRLHVYVPSYIAEVEVETKSGETVFADLDNGKLKLATGFCGVLVDNVRCDDVNITGLTGYTYVRKSRIKKLYVFSSAGDISLDGGVEDAFLKTMIGSIKCRFDSELVKAAVATVAGDMSVDLRDGRFKGHVKTFNGTLHVNGEETEGKKEFIFNDGEGLLIIGSFDGNITVNK